MMRQCSLKYGPNAGNGLVEPNKLCRYDNTIMKLPPGKRRSATTLLQASLVAIACSSP
jgi:hypothetical protein